MPFRRAATSGLGATLSGLGRIRQPKLRGKLRMDGLEATVEVLRDRWGVPHIYAGSMTDLLFAQGFVHAQDRLWQMDFHRRLVAGRLAEVLGPAALPIDRGTRILGMYRVAEAEVSMLGPQACAELGAYAAGVNACRERQPLPIEFRLLRYRPEPWRLADSLCWSKMMSWGLSVNWETELLRARLVEVLGPDRAAELEPFMPGPLIMRPGAYSDDIPPEPARPGLSFPETGFPPAADLEGDLPSTGGVPGSNNWVIAGSRTATGKPILANDMHLPISAPAIWYENHLVCTGTANELDVTGVSFVGVPYIIAGHNGRVAWGFTNGFPDVQDLFIEHLRRNERGAVEYEHCDRWLPAELRREEIRVKDRPAEVQEVIATVHGPIINELAPGLAAKAGPDGLPETPLALRWGSLDPQPMVEALRAMNHARSCMEFHQAVQGWIAPVQNMVYADTDGNIGYTYPGRVPVRKKGDGRTPVPGWTGEYDWDGWIPFDELPHLENPPAGFIVSANNQVVDAGYPYFIGREFAQGDRAARITELILLNPKITVSDVREMQLDQEATSLKRIAQHLAALAVEEPELQGLVDLVRAWDGQLTAESPAAAVCEIFLRLAQTVVMEAKLPTGRGEDEEIPLLDRVRGQGPTPGLQEGSFFYHRLAEWLYSILERPESHWWDLGQGETRDDVLRLALHRTYNYLVPRLGEPELPGYDNWGWGRLHLVTFAHVVGRVPALASYFNRGPYPVGGDENTIFATGGRVTVEGSTAMIGPPFRFIADLSDLTRCYGLLAPGNSGRPDSPHYDDQIEPWFKGKYHPMLYKREDVERGARHRLVLTPG